MSRKSDTKVEVHKPKDKTGLNAKGRVDWSDVANLSCLLFVDHGLSAKAITRATRLSQNKIGYRCKMSKRRIRDYRDGTGPVARVLIQQWGVRTITPKDARSLRKQFVVPKTK